MRTAYIKIRLYQMNKTQKQMATDLDINYSYLSSLINGSSKPSTDTLLKIGDYIGADYNELLAE